MSTIPEILAPAGNKNAFLAAVAAGADAIYCGLKQFSARMAAANFTFEELAALTRLAHTNNISVYVAFNTLVKPNELERAAKFLYRLDHEVEPDALIVQDLGLLNLARRIGFKKEIHLSTLSNVTFPEALKLINGPTDVQRVVLPRELNIDEIKSMAAACPADLGLEVFVHGALCYGVSGRCYWSSYFGGKSGLRGRCVQPCRRRYRDLHDGDDRFFSCQDLSLDVLVKVLLSIPQIKTWKIEGRKKGPHYVYYTVSAYKMLRDEGSDPRKKRAALELLNRALGRVTTHYGFLPQRPQNPVKLGIQTGSGLLMGYLKEFKGQAFLNPREALLAGDLLRVGYEDDTWHVVKRVKRHVPAKGRLYLKMPSGGRRVKGTPVFLVDRQEKHLGDLIRNLEQQLVLAEPMTKPPVAQPSFSDRINKSRPKKRPPVHMQVNRMPATQLTTEMAGLWLSPAAVSASKKQNVKKIWWWLPPVTWPSQKDALQKIIRHITKLGAKQFVLNMPWQSVFFKKESAAILWAGPFCNIANGQAIRLLKRQGFSGVIVSPELGQQDYLQLPSQSALPLGLVLTANWPLCISRSLSDGINLKEPFTSPKGEVSWAVEYDQNYWLYPNWIVDLNQKRKALTAAGYTVFIHLSEPVPKKVKIKKRPGLWNWNVGLK